MDYAKLFSLKGRTALVTGGNSGLGEAMATALGLAGARVILVARRQDALDTAAEKMQKAGIEVHTISTDVTKIENVLACAEKAKKIAHVDILINGAGTNLRRPFVEVRPEDWETEMALHLTAPFFFTQALAPNMAEKNWGRIINIASLQSHRAFPNSAPYGAGKGGTMQLTRAMAQEWSPKGITCNAIGGGFFPTPLTAPVFNNPELVKQSAARTAANRTGVLEDLYGPVVFLASDASGYITGQTIMVDGGFTAI